MLKGAPKTDLMLVQRDFRPKLPPSFFNASIPVSSLQMEHNCDRHMTAVNIEKSKASKTRRMTRTT